MRKTMTCRQTTAVFCLHSWWPSENCQCWTDCVDISTLLQCCSPAVKQQCDTFLIHLIRPYTVHTGMFCVRKRFETEPGKKISSFVTMKLQLVGFNKIGSLRKYFYFLLFSFKPAFTWIFLKPYWYEIQVIVKWSAILCPCSDNKKNWFRDWLMSNDGRHHNLHSSFN